MLSPTDSIREDILPIRGLEDLRRFGRSASVSDNGPIVFTENVLFRTNGLTANTTKRDTPQNGTVFSPTHPTTLYLQTLKSPPIYLQIALNSLNIGSSSSIRKAAVKFGASKSTLAYRRGGRPSRANADRSTQRLSLQEERTLIQWIRDLQRQNLCPDYSKIRRFTHEILRNKGDSRPLGKNYISRFISRHSGLRTSRSRPMNIKRLSALDSTIIEAFFY